jgi:FlaA1/EpsC-like NDP-sugar epimerase
MSFVSNLVLNFRLPLIFTLNTVLTFVSLFIALGLRFDFEYSEISGYYLELPLLLLILFRQASYVYFSLNEGYWRYTSMNDLRNIIKAHLLSSILFATSIWGFQLSFPRSVIIGEFVLSIFLCGGSRFVSRWISEYLLDREAMKNGSNQKDSIILGAGNSGHLLVKLLQTSHHIPYKPSMVLDDLERLKGSSVYGVRVEGTISKLDEILAVNKMISAVFVAIPTLSEERINEIKEICNKHNVAFKRLQSFEDIACLDPNEDGAGKNIEALLDKEIHVEHEEQIANALFGKRVLVTGAGGSIGSELVRQILNFKPQKLILVDNSEFNLFKMSEELKNSKENIVFNIADICDVARISKIFEEHKPEYIFHAAAYKHVPLMEINCYEAFKNNVLGTRRLHDLAAMHQVEKFVFISSDKAVDPCSIMGCSKKIGEIFIQHQAIVSSNTLKHNMRSAVVRFGNVINSAGSVIPLFKDQIAKGGPITVTHPDMDRFFMSIREAVRLVLTAGTFEESGEIYVLDMGKKIKIVDLANKMLQLYGRRDIKIVFTGLRPGEKMTEYLLAPYESLSNTELKKVGRLSSKLIVTSDIITWLNEMEKNLKAMSNLEIASAMKDFISLVESKIGQNQNMVING